MKRVGIKDVAKEAGVATSTVSYVLNQKTTETISEETKKRVLDAVKKLGYVPNLNARSLSSRKSNLIGVLIPQTEPGKEFMFSNPFYGELLSSIEYTARKNGYHLILSGTEEDQDYLHVAQNRGVDGITEHEKAAVQEFRDHIDHHCWDQDGILVPATLRERFSPPDRQRRKHQIIAQDFQHGFRHIVCAAESVLPVGREIEQHRKKQGYKIRRAIFQFFHRGIWEELQENGQGIKMQRRSQNRETG